MSDRAHRFIFWTPRILCIAFAAFLSIFALDVFEMNAGPWQITLALLMHLIPTALVLLVLAICWRHEWIGGGLFPALALLHLVSMWGRLHWQAYLGIELPLWLLGALFIWNWRERRAIT